MTFHDLRHDFAHRARQSGWSLEEIAVYAGHQTKDGAPAIATTVRYTLPSRKQLKERVVILLSPTQRAKMLQIPDTFSERDITRYYSLSAEDLAVIEQHRRPQNRLGFTVQLAYLRFPGRPWDPQEQVPPAVLTYLAEQIGEAPDVLADYATRDPTRREHLSEIQRVFQFHPFTGNCGHAM